jgi:hypothetical protein
MTTLAEKRRARFERELWFYSRETYLGKDQPPYMPELRALYMAVRETHKGSMPKGADVDHMWPRVIGSAPRGRRKQAA